MAQQQQNSALQGALVTLGAFALGLYFAFHAVQGEYGLFSRVQIEAEEKDLTRELETLQSQLAVLRNKTMRLSDQFLDLDLLDERARDVLGLLRPDEILVH